MFSSSPEMQIEIEKLSEALSSLPVGEIFTYADLRDAAGGEYKPWSLMRARKITESETGARFGTIHGKGVKRLAAQDLAGIGSHARSRIGKIARRQSARLVGFAHNDIDGETQRRIDVERSLLGAISALSSGSSAKIVEREAATGPVVFKRVLELLS